MKMPNHHQVCTKAVTVDLKPSLTVCALDVSPRASPRHQKQLPDHIKDGLSKYAGVSVISTVLPTMWMGAQNGK